MVEIESPIPDMETEQRHFHDEGSIHEYYTSIYNPQEGIIQNRSDLLFSCTEQDFNTIPYLLQLQNQAEKKARVSQQLESLQSIELPTVHLKQEEENYDRFIQDMFPELHGVEAMLTESLEELHNVENVLPEPQKEKAEIVKGVEGENECKNVDDLPLSTDGKIEEIEREREIKTEKEINIDLPSTSRQAYGSVKKDTSTKKVRPYAKKRKTNTGNVTPKMKQEQEESAGEGIEAVDLPSLLEKFEEIEKSETLPNDKPTVEDVRRVKLPNKTRNVKQRSCQTDGASNKSTIYTPCHAENSCEKVVMTEVPKRTVLTTHAVLNTEYSENRSNIMFKSKESNSSSIDLEHDYCKVYSNERASKNTSKSHRSETSNQSERCDNQPKKSDVILTQVSCAVNSPSAQKAAPNLINKAPATGDMNIQSVLARTILKSRQKSFAMETQTGPKALQLVSVLKKQQNSSTQCSILTKNIKESIVTTINSSNDEIKNIIQQDNTENIPVQETKKPIRKKLNLEEYRKKREFSNNSNKTGISVQRKLVYLYNAYTMTKPFVEKGEEIWSGCEIDTAIKSVLDNDAGNTKLLNCDAAVQTYETIFEFSGKSPQQESKRRSSRSKSNTKSRSRSKSRTRNKSSSSSSSSSRSRSESRRTRRSGNKSIYRRRSVERNRNKRRSRKSSTSESRSRSLSRNRSSNHSKNRSRSKSRSSSEETRHSRVRRTSRQRSHDSSTSSSLLSTSSSRYYSRRSRSSSRGRSRRSNNRGSNDRERYYDRRYSRSRQDQDMRRSPLSYHRRHQNERYRKEWQRQVDERRVIYVGNIENGITKADLHRRFERFGRIVGISLHFRPQTNYGFVTFEHKADAYTAIEHGNDGQFPIYQISFGGRRAFCQVNYADLDGAATSSHGSGSSASTENDDYDIVLHKEMRRRKLV
ncbi:PREDICTED: uncharacterized protein LOC106746862 isoform X2 [Dinoponera quadriceps]|uniref:Uncharacterized protein LOC106746862 isoform X2 n=1 Tax=Dinoponera quadriceps TaxID=609295 RepID=A0A6P3XLX3_DINQU|nr:PREDICTED: uncharacterized protein LOC106746862 isoform X2 [Dinoponera quadriceps]